MTFPGTIVYAKAGNIWVQTGKDAKQLTSGGNDSMPSWAPDGSSVYFIRTADGVGHWPAGGILRDYQMTIPSIMRINANGTGDPVRLLNGRVTKNGRVWHSWIREPELSPDGHTMAMVSDRPESVAERRRPPVLRHDHQEVEGPAAGRDAAARPPGSDLAAGWQGPALRPQRS